MNMGKRAIVSLMIGWMLCLFSLQAQISHGGKPLPLSPLAGYGPHVGTSNSIY